MPDMKSGIVASTPILPMRLRSSPLSWVNRSATVIECADSWELSVPCESWDFCEVREGGREGSGERCTTSSDRASATSRDTAALPADR
ncbi:hypothetical protein [Streptomyces sp. NBC_01171]|uniref:hypothetical protein n=1 Tax=Streptomyces sp. NBC_01171 TaxID=2903757 RepID=UPI0038649937|nr:hypothetical protein OG448_27135 [Streptomyces sp. NBC_01171]